jgi:hypothetical protein
MHLRSRHLQRAGKATSVSGYSQGIASRAQLQLHCMLGIGSVVLRPLSHTESNKTLYQLYLPGQENT